MHKYVYHRDQLSSVYSSYFEENTLIHHPNTGQKHQFHISSVSYEYGKRTIRFKGIKLWYNLPVNIKETKWLQSFKHKIQGFVHRSVTLCRDLIICICINWLYFVYECMFNRFIYIGLLIYVMAQSCFVCFLLALLCSVCFFFHYPYCYVDIGGQHWWSRYSLWQPATIHIVLLSWQINSLSHYLSHTLSVSVCVCVCVYFLPALQPPASMGP